MADPRDGIAPLPRRRERSAQTAMLIGFAFVALLVVALYVTFFLTPSAPLTNVVAPAASPPAASAPPAPTVEEPDKQEAERLLAEALRRVARLDGEGIRQWGDEIVQGVSPPSARQTFERATALLDRRQYGEALPLLRQSLDEFDTLIQSRPERLRLALDRGLQALEARDATAAVQHFEIAAALGPGDEAATTGLTRARILPQVLERFSQGESAERGGNLPAARDHYQAAAALDPRFEPAREPLKRVEAALAANAYRLAISQALASLSSGDMGGAEAALERARRLQPRAPEVQDIGQRLRAAVQVSRLERLRTQAAAAEGEEKWPEAVRLYDQALALDRSAAFAAGSRERAQGLAQLHSAIDAYIAQPARLYSAEPLAHARTLVVQAAPEGEGPVLKRKKEQLTRLIAAAQAPVSVTLRSDGQTQVTLLRVGGLGTFETRRVDLPPGRYVAVGARPGYRDARVTFEVNPATADPSVVVQCTEPIR